MTTSMLGFGFNILNTLDLTTGATTSVVSSADDNVVSSPTDEPTSNQTHVFSSRQQVTEHFATSVGMEYSGYGFDGEFSAKYGSESDTTSSSLYGLFSIEAPMSITKILSTGNGNLNVSFAADPDVHDLPATFTPKTAEQFFRIFRRYGTHFISEITLGGRLNAYTTATVDSTDTAQSASASMKAEYEALFASGKAEADAEWGKVTSGYASNRTISFETIGGDSSALASFVPDVGIDDGGELVGQWLATVKSTPGIMGFRLSPLSALFDDAVGTAVQHAIAAFLAAVIRAEAWELSYPRQVSGGSATMDPKYASTITTPETGVITQPTTWSFGTLVPNQWTDWMWIMLLDPSGTVAPPLGSDGRSYLLQPGYVDAINADITAARKLIENPLIVLCGEFGDSDPSHGTTTIIPEQLQQLIEDCGFDLQGLARPNSPWQVISVIGVANVDSPCLVTAVDRSTDGFDWADPARSTAQYLDGSLTPIAQDGIVYSPAA